MTTPSPTVRRKRLTVELRRLREQAGLTCEAVGHRLECSGTRISRMETGRIGARPGVAGDLRCDGCRGRLPGATCQGRAAQGLVARLWPGAPALVRGLRRA